MSREYIPVALRQLVIDRACGYCEYCRSSGDFALESMEFEHIVPVSQGGTTVAENLALACHGCNNYSNLELRESIQFQQRLSLFIIRAKCYGVSILPGVRIPVWQSVSPQLAE
jgi:hypothetical protein